MWWIIAAAIIALLVVIFLLIWFKGAGEGAFGAINKNIAGVGDYDGDKVVDMFDKCPCDPGESGAKLEGCPIRVRDTTDPLTKKRIENNACKTT